MTAEQRLYRYPINVAKLEALRQEAQGLSSVHVQNYQPGKSCGGEDPVSRTAVRRMALEGQIAKLEREIRPIRRMLEDMENGSEAMRQRAEVLKRRYFKRESWGEVQEGMSLSFSTLQRRKRELLLIAEEYFS